MTKEREDKFVELAEKRVKNALNALRLIKNLANKSNYGQNKSQQIKMSETNSLRSYTGDT